MSTSVGQWVWLSRLNRRYQDAPFARGRLLQHSSLTIAKNLVALQPEDHLVHVPEFAPAPRPPAALLCRPVRPVIPGQTSSRSSADRKGAAR